MFILDFTSFDNMNQKMRPYVLPYVRNKAIWRIFMIKVDTVFIEEEPQQFFL